MDSFLWSGLKLEAIIICSMRTGPRLERQVGSNCRSWSEKYMARPGRIIFTVRPENVPDAAEPLELND